MDDGTDRSGKSVDGAACEYAAVVDWEATVNVDALGLRFHVGFGFSILSAGAGLQIGVEDTIIDVKAAAGLGFQFRVGAGNIDVER